MPEPEIATVRVLHVEDRPEDAELIARRLRDEGLDIVYSCVATGEDFVRQLREFLPDVILCDHLMPQFTSSDVLRIVGESAPAIPVIVVTGTLGEEKAAERFRAGAADYVLKENLDRLAPAVQRALELKRTREERFRMEQALRDSERRFRALVEHSSDVLALVAPDGTVLFVSDAVENVKGFTPDEFVGLHITELVHNEDRAYAGEKLAETLANPGKVVTAEYRSRRKGGEWRYMEAVGVNRVDEPAVGAVVLNFRDVTDRKKAEESLRASEERYRVLAESSPVGIWHTTPDGKTIYINPAGCDLLEIDEPAELTGRSLYEFFTRESVATIRREEAQRARGTGSTYEAELVSAHGTNRTVLVAGAPIIGPDGALESVMGTLIDITDRKVLAEQLRHGQRMESIGRLAGGIAHDFNNVLTAILGTTDLLLMDLDPDAPHYEDVCEIRDAARRAAGLTSQLLAFSRKQVLVRRVLDLNALVQDTERLLRRIIGEDIELVTEFDPALGPVATDPSQLQQVILNLAVNARDAMPGGGRLTIATRNVTLRENHHREGVAMSAGRYAVLSVADTGVGMPPDVREQIFEPFFTTKGAGEGTGLGLATAYGIVKQSEGYIWVDSGPGEGTTFEIYLPHAAAQPEEHLGEPNGTETTGGDETVLLVEDEERVRVLSQRMLEMHGYRVLTASTGAEARRIFEERGGKVDLLVTDVVMPGESGRELADALRTDAPDLDVLFVSGYTSDAVIRRGVLSADVPFLQKPFTPVELVRKVREVLDDT